MVYKYCVLYTANQPTDYITCDVVFGLLAAATVSSLLIGTQYSPVFFPPSFHHKRQTPDTQSTESSATQVIIIRIYVDAIKIELYSTHLAFKRRQSATFEGETSRVELR